MNLLTRLQPLIIIAAALIGLGLGTMTSAGSAASGFIEPCLVAMLFFLFLSVDGRQLADSFRNVRFTVTALLVNFFWTPVFSFALGRLFFPESIDMQIGLMMLLVTPCTDWYLVFTTLARGNVALGASILPLNLLLQIVLLPGYLQLFFGSQVSLIQTSALAGIVLVLVVPFGLAAIVKGTSRRFGWMLNKRLTRVGDNAQLLFLCLAVVCMFASQSAEFFANPELLVRMLVPLALFFAVNFCLVRLVGRRLGFSRADLVPLNFTTLARNSPLSLAIAVAAFPQQPLISLALVIGPLIELPALALIAGVINRSKLMRVEE